MWVRVYLAIIAAFATAAVLTPLWIVLAPVAEALAWAMVFGIASFPMYQKVAAMLPRHHNISAILMVFLMTVFMILPISGVVAFIALNLVGWMEEAQRELQSLRMPGLDAAGDVPLLGKVVSRIRLLGIDVTAEMERLAENASRTVMNAAANGVINLASLFLTLLLALFILFFIYRDGEKLLTGLERLFGHHPRLKYHLSEFGSTTTAVIMGTLYTCFVQGGLAWLGYVVAGVPLPVLCALLTAVAGFVPVVGTTVVWIPIVIYTAVGIGYDRAFLLLLWSLLVVVAVTDYLIRPLLVGSQSRVPVLAVVLGAIGGTVAYGLLGLFLGPILLAALVTVWRDFTSTTPR